jgi:hypothetical protein
MEYSDMRCYFVDKANVRYTEGLLNLLQSQNLLLENGEQILSLWTCVRQKECRYMWVHVH